ncbi:AMP-binding protein, partial [Streptomyces caeruleatus]
INNTKSDYKEKNIDQLFLEQVKNNPDIEAVVSPFEKRSLTYKELEKASLAHAKYLIKSGVKPGDLVIVALERSLAEAVVLISILRIGATY